MFRIAQRLLVVIALVVPAACRSYVSPNQSASLWVHHSAEYRAATKAVYQSAIRGLGLALQDPSWTAALEQEAAEASKLPAAVILDIDETVLNNSGYLLQTIQDRSSYEESTWDRWVASSRATAVAGALEYVRAAKEASVAVAYITNRSCIPRESGGPCPQREDTLRNLYELGFPRLRASDQLLLKKAQPEWSSEKASRRRHVASRFRILQIIGDDLGDFVEGARQMNAAERLETVERHAEKWGSLWFLLPNPMYGSWTSALPPDPIRTD